MTDHQTIAAGTEEARHTAELMRSSLAGFAALRTDIVRRLRADGDRELAGRIAALRKPSVALWALNQAGAVAAADLDAVRNAGEALQRAQERVLQGDRAAVAVMQSTAQQQRAAIDALTRRLGMVLTAAGHAASDQTLRRVSDGLRNASVADAMTWDAVRDGRLVSEPDAASFPAMGVPGMKRMSRELDRRDEAAHRKRVDTAEAALRQAEELAESAREHAAAAQRRLEEATQAVDDARAALAAARSEE